MDWLKDPKNQPIVAAILAVVIVGAGVALYFMAFKGPPTAPSTSETTEAAPAATGPTGMPAAAPTAVTPAATAVTPTAPAPPPGGPVAKATPMETWRQDPFLPVGYRPPKNGTKPKPRILDFPFYYFPPPRKRLQDALQPEPPQPIRRLSGVMLNGRVYAIIETNGKFQVVQPGEPLEDGLAVVERIEADKVILKTVGKPSRYLTVRLASAPQARAGSIPAIPPGPTEGPPMGGPYGPRRDYPDSRRGPRGSGGS